MTPSPVSTLIQQIDLVDEITRPDSVRFRAVTTPRHMIHITLSGEVKQSASGQIEHFKAGDVIWYHQAEPIEGEILRSPWQFITISFSAPDLPPPPFGKRIMNPGPQTVDLAKNLLRFWRDQASPSLERSLRCSETLTRLLLDFAPLATFPKNESPLVPQSQNQWWLVERQLRLQLDYPFSLEDIAKLANTSIRSINRLCKLATGTSPIRRLRLLRMAHARGLVQHSNLSITEIAFQIGHARVQEFSRDFKRQYGQTPRQARKSTPDYQQL